MKKSEKEQKASFDEWKEAFRSLPGVTLFEDLEHVKKTIITENGEVTCNTSILGIVAPDRETMLSETDDGGRSPEFACYSDLTADFDDKIEGTWNNIYLEVAKHVSKHLLPSLLIKE